MAAIYMSSFLRSLSSSIQTNNHLAPDLWQRLTSLGLSRVKPTHRGLHGGNRRRQVLPRHGTVLESSMGQPLSSYGSFLANFPGKKVNLNGESNLHTAPSSTLNIQIDTLQRVGINNSSILVIKPRNRLWDRPYGSQRLPGVCRRNLSRFASTIPSNQGKENSVFGLSALLANTMSLAPKIDEVRSVVLDLKPNLGFFTETWLRETICDSLLQIPGYSFIHRNCTTDHHSSVGLYIENSIKFKHLEKLSDPDIEALWAWLRPSRLPHGVPCIVATLQQQHQRCSTCELSVCVPHFFGRRVPRLQFPVVRRFNRLNTRRLNTQFKLKQLEDKPTRGDQILDLVLTNLPQLYDSNAVQTFPPFGMSDHNVVLVRPKGNGCSMRTTARRDTRPSRKLELGGYLSSIDWSPVNGDDCEARLSMFVDIIQIGMDHIMLVKHIKTHVNDAPWIPAEFKNLIKLRQQAFNKGDKDAFSRYCNIVNRKQKSLRVCGLGCFEAIKPRKAAGPEFVPNWLLREYAEVLVEPVTAILNSSYKEQKLPSLWKLADVVPLPKQKPVEDLSKYLRPISLTATISKLVEDFVVATHVGPTVLKKIDYDQYGGIPESSTSFALILMFHHWSQATDGTGAAVRVVLFDYQKAFYLIDHTILVANINGLDMPRSIKAWVTDFLINRQQWVKLSADCFSEWGPVPAGVPQGTKLGPWLFLLMINDLKVDAPTWKYIDDTTISQTIPHGSLGDVQGVVTAVDTWSQSQLMQLKADKCKELIIDFKENPHNFSPLVVDSKSLPVIDCAKILGVTISCDLKWNNHVVDCIKKANKRIYFIVLLKRARVPCNDIVDFYCTTIRSVLEYCAPLFHHALPAYLSKDIERILNSIANNSGHKLHNLLPPRNEQSYCLRQQRTYNLPHSCTDRFRQSFVYAMSKDA
ncbi:uncharacterized protein [Pocillopora verrucosa]|uniref:uncharacterized protein n=1 Tax=Pocillopora verrucosa TaxID=203993 RepID=UPI00333FC114